MQLSRLEAMRDGNSWRKCGKETWKRSLGHAGAEGCWASRRGSPGKLTKHRQPKKSITTKPQPQHQGQPSCTYLLGVFGVSHLVVDVWHHLQGAAQ